MSTLVGSRTLYRQRTLIDKLFLCDFFLHTYRSSYPQ